MSEPIADQRAPRSKWPARSLALSLCFASYAVAVFADDSIGTWAVSDWLNGVLLGAGVMLGMTTELR